MGAQKLRAREWVLKTQKHVQMWYVKCGILSEPAGMSIIIINSRNSSFALCSLLRTRPWMIRAALLCCQWEAAAEAGKIFGVPAEQCFFSSQLFLITFKWLGHGAVFPVSGNGNPRMNPEGKDYRTLWVERGTCFRSTPGFDHIPLSRLNTPHLSLMKDLFKLKSRHL